MFYLQRVEKEIREMEQNMTTVHVLTESLCRPDNEPHLDVNAIRKRSNVIQRRIDVSSI